MFLFEKYIHFHHYSWFVSTIYRNKKARVEAIRRAILSQILPEGVGEDKLPSAEDLSKEGFGPAVDLQLPQLNQPGTVQVLSSEQLQESVEDLSNEIDANLPGGNSPLLLQRVLDAANHAAAINNQVSYNKEEL